MIPKFPDQQQLPHSTFVLKSVPLAVGANPKGSAKDCKRLLSGLTRMALTQLLLRRSYKVITAASVAEATGCKKMWSAVALQVLWLI